MGLRQIRKFSIFSQRSNTTVSFTMKQNSSVGSLSRPWRNVNGETTFGALTWHLFLPTLLPVWPDCWIICLLFGHLQHLKIAQKHIKFATISSKCLKSKRTLSKWPKLFNVVAKWRNFAESGHTVSMQMFCGESLPTYYPLYLLLLPLCYLSCEMQSVLFQSTCSLMMRNV